MQQKLFHDETSPLQMLNMVISLKLFFQQVEYY